MRFRCSKCWSMMTPGSRPSPALICVIRCLGVVPLVPKATMWLLIADAPALVSPSGLMEVIGKGSVTILDPSRLETDAYEVKRHKPIMVSGVILHSLPSGYRFDLRRRRLLTPLRSLSMTENQQARLEAAGAQTRRLIRRVAAEGADDTAPERARRRALRAHRDEEASE